MVAADVLQQAVVVSWDLVEVVGVVVAWVVEDVATTTRTKK